MPPRFRFFALLTFLLVTVGSFAFAQDAERIEVVIELREFSFTVAGGEANAPIVFKAGQPYSVVFSNVGMMGHEVLVGRSVLVEDGVPDGYETNLLDALPVKVAGDDWEVGTSGFVEVELEPGQSVEIYFTLPTELIGTWEIGCFVPGHYQAGMKAAVIVE
ncbi:MAG: hypothetical protein P1P87_16950 [Trueperaceae bacterium]|nr:hypothetical protein [Trueperaceae bacterium]